MRWWPGLALLSVALVESRLLVTTPALSKTQLAHPDAAMQKEVNDLLPDMLVGYGVSLLGATAMVLFVVAFAEWLRRNSVTGPAVTLMLIGAAVTLGGVMIGYGTLISLAAASEEGSPSSVAAVYLVGDSLGYVGWTSLGLVTGGAFWALRRVSSVPAWIRWFSLGVTVVFVICAFLPFFSWAPAMLWLLVVGIGLSLVPDARNDLPARAAPRPSRATTTTT